MAQSAAQQQNQARFYGQLVSYIQQVQQYEDITLQEYARSKIPLQQLRAKANTAVQNGEQSCADIALLVALLEWFKKEFFTWVNKAPCDSCGETNTQQVRQEAAKLPQERQYLAGSVEVYSCTRCKNETRFPRYNHARALLDSRRGRCGEWAQCFTLCCRAVALEARVVYDWTDHVWTEVWSSTQQRFLHADSCENICDQPLLYEGGWGKKLNYCIAVGHLGLCDVTFRYTAKHEEVWTQRRVLVSEAWLAQNLASINEGILGRLADSAGGLLLPLAFVMIESDEKAKKIAEQKTQNTQQQALPGRQSGSAEWVRQRGEDGGVLQKETNKNPNLDQTSSSQKSQLRDIEIFPLDLVQTVKAIYVRIQQIKTCREQVKNLIANLKKQTLAEFLQWFFKDFWKNESLQCIYCKYELESDKILKFQVPESLPNTPTADSSEESSAFIEVFSCGMCYRVNQVKRLENLQKIIQKRSGRLADAALAFCLLSSAAGFDSRCVLFQVSSDSEKNSTRYKYSFGVEIWCPEENRFTVVDLISSKLQPKAIKSSSFSLAVAVGDLGISDVSQNYVSVAHKQSIVQRELEEVMGNVNEAVMNSILDQEELLTKAVAFMEADQQGQSEFQQLKEIESQNSSSKNQQQQVQSSQISNLANENEEEKQKIDIADKKFKAEQQFKERVQNYLIRVQQYEAESAQKAALMTIPLQQLQEKAREQLEEQGCPDLALLKELLRWFKQDFFRWLDRPQCEQCGESNTEYVETLQVPETGAQDAVNDLQEQTKPQEQNTAMMRMEIYKCVKCDKNTHFNRYNNPVTLLRTRQGRCGEWANCFTLCCRAAGLKAALVVDWTDHVWTEVWSNKQQRFVHADSCENIYDKPLLYEEGWGKKLTFIVSFSAQSGAREVSQKYTRKREEMLQRRAETHLSEQKVTEIIMAVNQELGFNQQSLYEKNIEQDKLEVHNHGMQEEKLPSRISGDAQWIKSRGEDGASVNK